MTYTLLRDVLDRPGHKVGCGVGEMPVPCIGHLLAAGGADFCFLDMEHSGISTETVKQVLVYMQAADVPTLVRPPSDAYHHIAGVLDSGAQGLLLPMVGSAEQARTIVSRMKYPPMGVRGVGMGYGNDRYRVHPAAARQVEANRQTMCMTLIETVDGLNNVEEIAAVEGVDVIWIGHSDLSASMGIPGQYKSQAFQDAQKRIIAAGKKAGKHLCRAAADVAEGKEFIRLGIDMIAYSNDTKLLRTAIKEGIDALR